MIINFVGHIVSPNLMVSVEINEMLPKIKTITVWAQDIKGIIYYLDDDGNVYDPADIVNNQRNPKIIAKYQCIDEHYSIPAFEL